MDVEVTNTGIIDINHGKRKFALFFFIALHDCPWLMVLELKHLNRCLEINVGPGCGNLMSIALLVLFK